MCRFTHPLAAIGTMSWPDCGVERPLRGCRRAFLVYLWKHLMAETADLEASVGRECRKLFVAATYKRANSYQLLLAGGDSEIKGQSREASDQTAICVESALAIAMKQLAANGGDNNRSCTVRNHPMAAHFWKQQFAKTAIGWVE